MFLRLLHESLARQAHLQCRAYLASSSLSSRNFSSSRPTAYLPNGSREDAIVDPTIFAPATPPGKSAIAIVRISGPEARQVWKLTKSKAKRKGTEKSLHHGQDVQPRASGDWPPPARRAMLREIYNPKTGDKIDEGIVLFFPAASSLTAQDMLELHLHGSTAVMRLVLQTLGSIKGLRPAEPGEFTRLALHNGRMDLTEVEGLRDLIESETEAQRKLAVRQAGGQMKEAYESMRKDIISAMSVMEALIDFGEDESIDMGVYEPAYLRIAQLRDKIVKHLSQAKTAEIIRNGIRVAIFGAPNAGKSSFINWLARREASIVTAHPGTTRDVVELSLDFMGYPVIVSDTAGLREAQDEVEQIGVERAKTVVASADLKICMVSLPEAVLAAQDGRAGIPLDPLTASLVDEKTLYILNKTDATSQDSHSKDAPAEDVRNLVASRLGLNEEARRSRLAAVSLKDMTGLDDLSTLLGETIKERFDTDYTGETLLVTRERHRFHLEECLVCLDAFLENTGEELDIVNSAEELRYAAEALGKVTGRIQVDEILDELFSTFCIGK